MELYDYQKRFINEQENSYLQGARRVGKTTAAAVKAWRSALDDGQTIDVFVPTMVMGCNFISAIHDELDIMSEAIIETENKDRIALANGGVIDMHSVASITAENIHKRIDDPDRVIFEEASHIEAETADIIRGAIDYRTSVDVVSTPLPEQTWVNEFADHSDTVVIWASAFDNPKIDTDFLETYRDGVPVERDLTDIYGVSPPDAVNVGDD